MTNFRNKTISIAIVLLFATAFLAVSISSTNATLTLSTYTYMVAFPNPVGVGQTVNLVVFLDEYPPYVMNGSSRIAATNGQTWNGLTITITAPDGTKQTLGPHSSDAIGAWGTQFTPNMIGNYAIQGHYPGQTMPANQAGGSTYAASDSRTVTLTVQQEQLQLLAPLPLPTGYWQRPINGEETQWGAISGNWLMAGNDYYSRAFDGGSAVNLYTTAPNTAHILWTKPLTDGGIVGGQYTPDIYHTGSSYELKMTPPVIINGILYYNTINRPDRAGASNPPGFAAVDIRTGKVVYTANVTNVAPTLNIAGKPQYGENFGGISLGQTYDYISPNQDGAFAYLWAIGVAGLGQPANITYDMYDAFTGNHWLTFVNGSSGTPVISPVVPGVGGGDLLVYLYNPTAGWVAMWNSTRAILRSEVTLLPNNQYGPNVDLLAQATYGSWYWRPPYGAVLDWNIGIQWNTTIPKLPTVESVSVPGTTTTASFLAGTQPFGGTTLVAQLVIPPSNTSATGMPTIEDIGYSATTGNQLWAQNYTNLGLQSRGGHITPQDSGIYCQFNAETLQWYGISINTGLEVWGPTAPYTNDWGRFSSDDAAAYGKLYGAGIDGSIHAYDITTGKPLWTWSSGPSAYEPNSFNNPYGVYPLYGGLVIADGKIYANEGTHGNGAGLWRGNTIICIDANSGNQIWRMAGWFDGATMAIADGIAIAHNYYDNQMYGIGVGQSATSVVVPPTAVTAGETIPIKGTVTDQSPGQTCLGIPAAGTPAISDDSMSAWMEYLYMQRPMPTNATGVPVQLVAIDSSGASTTIGTATSDSTGFYDTHWTVPTTPGDYKIIANFAGTHAYYSSSAVTAITVVAAGPTPASAGDVASAVVSQLPAQTPVPTAPSASDVASQVVSQLPGEDNTLLYAVIAIVIIALLIGLVNLVLMLRKKKA